jgi:hypothetical protein
MPKLLKGMGDQLSAHVNTAMNLQFHKLFGEFLD